MSYVDKTLTCVECSASFEFTAAEQEFFASRGLNNEPKRCPECRQARKQQRRDSRGGWDNDGYRRPREMYAAVCASCGKETEVPFEPREGRTVYCSECYSKVKR